MVLIILTIPHHSYRTIRITQIVIKRRHRPQIQQIRMTSVQIWQNGYMKMPGGMGNMISQDTVSIIDYFNQRLEQINSMKD